MKRFPLLALMLVALLSVAAAKETTGEKFRSKITRIDGQNITVAPYEVDKKLNDGRTFGVTDDTAITIGGKPAKLSHLVVDMQIDVTLDKDNKNALKINLETNRLR